MKTYEIKIKNFRTTPVALYDGEKPFVKITSGGIFNLECVNPRAIYSRWSEVVFVETGIRLTERKGWEPPIAPAGFVSVELLNKDGREIEMREVDGRQIFLPRDIPVSVIVPVSDPLAKARKIEIKYEVERVKSDLHLGYFQTFRILRDVISEARPEE